MRDLDSAFLRHGRFDYVLPIRPPDEEARAAMWQRHVGAAGDEVVVAELVRATEGFTPADIEQAARTVAQQVFECTIDTGRRCHGSTGDYLAVISRTRPTLDQASVQAFAEDIAAMART